MKGESRVVSESKETRAEDKEGNFKKHRRKEVG
jgi:hypothetical protein